MSKAFQFQQFTIHQEQVAMKVGTDGVLLGAWAAIKTAKTILDVGTGTGLLALMCAQRNANAHITGIDINKDAAQQAVENCNNSKWKNRIDIRHISLQDYVNESKTLYDAIICNPPYFKSTTQSSNYNRQQARERSNLRITELAKCSQQLLTKTGSIHLVFPFAEKEYLINTFIKYQFSVKKICIFYPTNNKPANRILVEFILNQNQQTINYIEDKIVLEPEKRHNYSKKYQQLTDEFYLKKI